MTLLLLFFSCTTEPNPEQIKKSTWYLAGKKVYGDTCITCHKSDGLGAKGVFPPLKGAQWLTREPELLASIITRGLGGEIIVAGETYRSAMPPQELSAQQTFDVIAYIRYEFAQKTPDFSLSDITTIHQKGGGTIYGQAELLEMFGK